MTKRVAVIGGGLAGTSAACELVRRGYGVTILEKNDRLGGRIHTECMGGVTVEMGAGFMTDAYTNLRGFVTRNGLDSKLYRQRSMSGIFRNGQVAMATPVTLLGNKTLSWSTKIQILLLVSKVLARWAQLDTHAFWKADKYDNRSVADTFSGPAQREFLESVLQPILNGYLYWTPEHTSEAMMLILGKAAFAHKTYKMQGGLQRIPEKAAVGSTVLLDHMVEGVQRQDDGSYALRVRYHGKSKIITTDGIVCATTANFVTTIFRELTKQQREFFEAIAYSTTALIARVYKQEQTRGNKAIAFPLQADTRLSSVTLSPEPGTGSAVLKAYASGTAGRRLGALPDRRLTEMLVTAMKPVQKALLLGNPEPSATYLQRWPEALPLFDVGHFKRLRVFESGEIEDQDRPIVFAGDYIGGPFMEGAFTSGTRAAERLDVKLR